MFLSRIRNQRGATIVFVAISLVVLLSMAALVIDLGRLYAAKQRAQNVADAAAIAAAWKLDGSAASLPLAEAEAAVIASANNAGTPSWAVDGLTVSFPAGYDEGSAIQVECGVPVTYGFARIMGHTAGRANALAIASRIAAGGLSYPLFPTVVADSNIWDADGVPIHEIGGESLTMKVVNPKDADNFVGPGNFLCAAFDGEKGADIFRDRVMGVADDVELDLDAEVPLGVETEPGNMSGPTEQGMLYRLAQDTVYTDNETAFDDWMADYEATGVYQNTPRLIIVPIVEDPGGNLAGRKSLTVVGFAAFFIEDFEYADKQDDNYGKIIGRFVSAVTVEDAIRWEMNVFGSTTGTLTTGVRLVE